MFAAAGNALAQIVTAPCRRVLLKSAGLALLILVVLGIALHRLVAALSAQGADWATGVWGTQWLWNFLLWVISFAAGLGLFTGALFLMPAVTAFVGSFFADEIAELVEREHYGNAPPGRAISFGRALVEGLKTALLAVAVYLAAAPFLLIGGLGFIVMFLANAYLLGREYFLLAAMRFRPPGEAKTLRRMRRTDVFFAGLIVAFVVSVPVLNLITPLFATALMVHVHKRLSQGAALRPPA
jgi:CysZ protein